MKDYKKYKFDLQPSPIDPQDIVLESIYTKKVELPKEFTLLPHLMPVRDQGEQGSCLAMSLSRLKEYHERMEINYQGYLSPQFVYNLRANAPSEGMIPRDGMRILHKIGIVPEEHYPYGRMRKPTPNLFKIAANLRIKAYARVDTIDCVKSAIIADGPVVAGLPVFNPQSEMFWLKTKPQMTFLGGHAVVFIGWNERGLIGVNSWGKNWGNRGYFLFPYEHWGIQWESWTAIDDNTCVDSLEKAINNTEQGQKSGCLTMFGVKFKKYWPWN
jgi:hypothetical protein